MPEDNMIPNNGKAADGAENANTASGLDASASSSEQDRKNIVQKGTEGLASRVHTRGDAGQNAATAAQVNGSDPKEYVIEHIHIPDDAPTLLLISGSPRKRASSSLVDLLEIGARESGVKTQRFELYNKRINPCIGCNACAKTGNCVFAGTVSKDHKGFDDDYLEFIGLLDRCDGLAVVAPIFFAGPTAQLKALYDRLQPYWARKYVLGQPFPQRRPSQLFLIGSGGDPHGYEPLVTISRSCLQIAGFEMEKTNNFIGYLAPQDAPVKPTEEQLKQMSTSEIAKLRLKLDAQEEFRNRAIAAGRAFGRQLHKEAELKAAKAAAAAASDDDVDSSDAAQSGSLG